jgi:hypothetical protein
LDPLAEAIARSPELFPLALDLAADQVTLVQLAEADYVRASFLDERLLGKRTVGRRTVPWHYLEEAAASLPMADASYIFHVGHVGSTLLSRLLGEHRHVFALREPAILRTFAQAFSASPSGRWSEAEFSQRLEATLQLLSRTFQPHQRAVIKVTSFASELAARILAQANEPRAVFMFVPAETYLATILGAQNSPAEATALAPSRLARLQVRLGQQPWSLSQLSLGEIVAMSWVCEMSALAAAAGAAADRVLWLNFDRLLEHPARRLSSVFAHLKIEATPNQIDALLAGPELRRYSKAPEHDYDASLRLTVLENGRRQHAAEICRGLDWINKAAEFTDLPKNVDNH